MLSIRSENVCSWAYIVVSVHYMNYVVWRSDAVTLSMGLCPVLWIPNWTSEPSLWTASAGGGELSRRSGSPRIWINGSGEAAGCLKLWQYGLVAWPDFLPCPLRSMQLLWHRLWPGIEWSWRRLCDSLWPGCGVLGWCSWGTLRRSLRTSAPSHDPSFLVFAI